MRSTLKSYFLGGCGEDLRRCTVRTSSKDLPKQAKKTTLRLDGIRFLLGIRINRFITAKIVSDDEWNPYKKRTAKVCKLSRRATVIYLIFSGILFKRTKQTAAFKISDGINIIQNVRSTFQKSIAPPR